jgi:hypothetical protein
VTSATSDTNNSTYAYDVNGNMTAGANRTFTWNGANLPTKITRGNASLTFSYGPDRARYKQVAVVSGSTETTHYVGGLYEKITTGTLTTHRHYIQAGQETIALYTTRSSGANDLRYLFHDHLGSVDVITDAAGAVKERLSYDAWGRRPSDELDRVHGPAHLHRAGAGLYGA